MAKGIKDKVAIIGMGYLNGSCIRNPRIALLALR